MDHAPLALLSDILFGGRASRAHQSMVQKAEVASDVRGWIGPFHHPGLVELQATARNGHTTGELIDALDLELDRVRQDPVTMQELDRAKARAELGLVHSMETCAGRAEQIAFYDTVTGDPAGAFDRLNRLRRTTRSDVLRVARRYLDPDHRTLIEVLPLSSEDASREGIA